MNCVALVVARHRQEVLLDTGDGQPIQGLLRGRKLGALVGDEVRFELAADGTAIVEDVLPRRTLLQRIDSRGRAEGVAANVSLLIVVLAPLPPPDWHLVDRYLVAGTLMGIDVALVRNKDDIQDSALDHRLSAYGDIGYRIMHLCARDASGIDEIRRLLCGHRAVLVGQSGVGKSSLTNALLSDASQAVRGLSLRRPLGRHTTTAAALYRLRSGGELIDSPGVRRYAPHIEEPRDLARGFREFGKFLGECRFNDCRHANEPGCAIREAVESGRISRERYLSYLALLETLARLQKPG